MNVEIKNFKVGTLSMHDSNCFECSIYIDGKRAGSADNDGGGGNTNVTINDKELEKAYYAYAEALPGIEYEGTLLPMDGEFLIDLLVEKKLDERLEKRRSKRATQVCNTDM